jgi:hypothetical protein
MRVPTGNRRLRITHSILLFPLPVKLRRDWMCWACAVDDELEDDFIVPETDPHLIDIAVRHFGVEACINVAHSGRIGPAPADEVDLASATEVIDLATSDAVIDLTDHDVEVDATVVEANKWGGNRTLHYQSELVKALSMSTIRESDVDHCSCADVTTGCDPRMCINGITQIECTPSNCGFGANDCGNRPVTFHHGAPLSLLKVPGIPGGYGCKADVDLKVGDYIGEYVGDVISNQAMRVRTAVSLMNGEECFYVMHLAGRGQQAVYIDAREKGNLTRFINHSEIANVTCLKWDVEGLTHCVFKAAQDIPAGKELLYNYGRRGKGMIPYFV